MDAQQGTPAWFSARQGKLTASRFGAAVGVCPWTSRAKALKDVLEPEDETPFSNDACIWGTKHEKDAVKDYMVRTGNVVRTKGFFTHPDHPWLGGSPDGLVGDDGLIEVKCPFYKKVCHEKIPPHYLCQINGLMEILDRQWCDFVTWTPTEMRIYRVYRDPELWSFLLDRYMVFFAFMKRGCAKPPRVTAAEKDETLRAIADSDIFTDYDYWSCRTPASLKGVWEGPPEYTDSDDEMPSWQSSKRPREDGTTDVRRVSGEEVRSGSDTAVSG